ncbi:hypothetical protein [Streptomyces venezuelae]
MPGPARPAGEPAELAALRGWLRAAKIAAVPAARDAGSRATFHYLAVQACASGKDYVVSDCTLRQALDGRMPTLRTTLAFARGAGADEETARRLRAAADRAVHPPRRRPAPHVPGWFTTRAGLIRAMNRIRATAPDARLRVLARKAGLSSSTLHRLLTNQQMPTATQLTAFAAACDAGESATAALLAGHRRVLNGPPPWTPYPCAYFELAEERRQRDEATRPWLAEREPELDWYDQQLRDEEEARFQRWVQDTEALLDELQDDLAQHTGAGAGAAEAADGKEGVSAGEFRVVRRT